MQWRLSILSSLTPMSSESSKSVRTMTERRLPGANHRQRWSPATDDQLREMAGSETDRGLIARRFVRTTAAISTRMGKLGLTGKS
jgi:hypothetical protein